MKFRVLERNGFYYVQRKVFIWWLDEMWPDNSPSQRTWPSLETAVNYIIVRKHEQAAEKKAVQKKPKVVWSD
jgi:hypothetical protein